MLKPDGPAVSLIPISSTVHICEFEFTVRVPRIAASPKSESPTHREHNFHDNVQSALVDRIYSGSRTQTSMPSRQHDVHPPDCTTCGLMPGPSSKVEPRTQSGVFMSRPLANTYLQTKQPCQNRLSSVSRHAEMDSQKVIG